MRLRYPFLLLALILLVSGCATRPEDIPGQVPGSSGDVPVAPPGDDPDIGTIEHQIAALKGQLAAKEAQLEAVEAQQQAARQRRLQYTAWWVAGLSMLAALGCLAAAMFFSVARKILLTAAASGFVLMIAALTLSYLIPYLVWVGVGFAVIFLIMILWYLYKQWVVVNETSSVGVEALDELLNLANGGPSPEALQQKALQAAKRIKDDARKRQAFLGVYKDVKKILEPHKARLNRCKEPDNDPREHRTGP